MIEQFISKYDGFDLYKKVSILNFYPQNQHYLATLYYLIGQILSNPFNKGDIISPVEVKKLIELAESEFGHLNDPFEQAFTEELSFYNGSHTIFPGYQKHSRFVLEHLLSAIFKSKLSKRKGFREAADIIINIFFSLSDEITFRLDLKRYTKVAEHEEFFVPERIHSAINSLTYTKDELLKLFSNDYLFDIFNSQLTFKKEDYQFFEEAQLDIQAKKPFLSYENEFVISDPGNLINSLRFQILKLANYYSVVDELCAEYHNSIWNNISKSCRSFGWKKVKFDLTDNEDFDLINEGVWGFDIDKCVYAITLEDHLNDHDYDNPFGDWNTIAQTEKIITRIEDCVSKLSEIVNLDKVFVVVFISSIGRNLYWALPTIKNEKIGSTLSINTSDFELLSFLEGGKDTILYKFSILLDQLSSRTMLMNSDTLDLYNLFKNKDYSFYIADDVKPDTFFLSFGDGRYLINEFIDRFDRHTVFFHDHKSYTQVIRLDPDPNIPIYLPLTLLHGDNTRSLLIEGYEIPVWIRESEEIENKLSSLASNFIQMSAYWLWQLTDQLKEYFELIGNHHKVFVFEFSLQNTDEWLTPDLDKTSKDSPLASSKLDVSKSKIDLLFYPIFKFRATSADNLAEREFICILIESISDILREYGYIRNATKLQAQRDLIVNRVAPLGAKKRIISLGSITNYQFDETNLPKIRYVQKYDEDIILDEVGYHIIHDLNYEIKTYEGSESVTLLNKCVNYLYAELTKLLDEVPFQKAIYHFISHNERLIQNREINKLSVPTNIACYSNESEVVRNLIESSQNNTKTALANRFIIEYLAAKQPNGSKNISNMEFDRIMALASEIINFAFQSDMIHFDLLDNKIPILKSERLGLNTNVLVDARNSFLPLQSEEYIRTAKNKFSSYWDEKVGTHEKSAELENDQKILNEAYKEEFGITFQSYLKIYGDIISLGLAYQDQPYKITSRTELFDYISLKGDLSVDEIEVALDLISLKKRKKYLSPPSPCTPEDVYPWRFMRPLSYLLKPLISIDLDDGEKFIWGTRGMITSVDYLMSIILNGRMQSRVTSEKLKSYMAKTHKEIGDDFNKYCSNIIRKEFPYLIVEEQLKKIGKYKIENDGNDLGDIDILVISKAKKNIFILECKDLSIARNPREMANEIDTLIKGKKNKSSTVEKHLSRTSWLKNNFDKLAEKYSLKRRGNWQFFPVIVVDEELFTPHLKESEIPIFSLSRFLSVYQKKF